MFYIKHGSDNFTIIDCCIDDENQKNIINELKEESKNKGIIRMISTHPDDDHIRGLKYLTENYTSFNFYSPEALRFSHRADFYDYSIK